MRRRSAALVVAALAAVPLPGAARAETLALHAERIAFFSDGLLLVARGHVTFDRGPLHGRADAASFDLRTDRLVLTGEASLVRGERRVTADTLRVELDADRVDAFDLIAGATRTSLALGPPVAETPDASLFSFPETDDGRAYIRARAAYVTPHAAVRFVPASFPTTVGAVPVPSYLYPFTGGSGWAAQSLPGATFDQPYHLTGTTHVLTSLHARYLDGVGAALGADTHLVRNDDAYAVASIDALNRGRARAAGLSGYVRSPLAAFTLDASNAYGVTAGHIGAARSLGILGSRVDYAATSFGSSSLGVSLRGPDRPLLAGATWRPTVGAGFDAQAGGLYAALPDAHRYATAWWKDVGISISSPVVPGPFGTRIGGIVSGDRRWYDLRRRDDSVSGSVTASRRFTRAASAALTYTWGWFADDWFERQRLLYRPPARTFIAPDGTPWRGFDAYDGYTTSRGLQLDLGDAPAADVSYKISIRTATDFPQFGGYGRPPLEIRFDARFRPLPNVGIAIGRSYDFAWGGVRWQPRWTLSILP